MSDPHIQMAPIFHYTKNVITCTKTYNSETNHLGKLRGGDLKIDRSKIDQCGRSFALIWAYDLFFDRILHLATFKCTVMVEKGPIMAKCFSQKKEK